VEVEGLNKVIAVEDNLGPVKEFLSARGCQVVSVEQARNRGVDAIILSGADENLMNMQDVVINVPIINASGRTAEQIWQSLNRLS